jgi:outer membrane protein OmpA-like peptidoglycan-associated protein
VAYLVECGIDAGRLQKVGKGESDPAADNTTEAGRQQNRRVVLRVQGQE